MNSRRKVFLLLLCSAVAAVPVHAQLKWDTEKVELSPLATDAYADAKFGFVNAGQETMTIETVQSSCGCTVPTLEKKTYAPGERGELLARFLIGDRRGVQEKTIRVQIKGERDPTLLALVVKIPEVVRITPPILIWEQGGTPAPKTFSVQAQANNQVRIQKATTTKPEMGIALETVTEAKDYRITITPKNTDQPGMALVTIEALVVDKPMLFTAYLQIKPKPR